MWTHVKRASHLTCSSATGWSSPPYTLCSRAGRTRSGRSSRRGVGTLCCTCCRSSARRSVPGWCTRAGRRRPCTPPSASPLRGWSSLCGCCARSAARRLDRRQESNLDLYSVINGKSSVNDLLWLSVRMFAAHVRAETVRSVLICHLFWFWKVEINLRYQTSLSLRAQENQWQR